jgi:hypothetical protein
MVISFGISVWLYLAKNTPNDVSERNQASVKSLASEASFFTENGPHAGYSNYLKIHSMYLSEQFSEIPDDTPGKKDVEPLFQSIPKQ